MFLGIQKQSKYIFDYSYNFIYKYSACQLQSKFDMWQIYQEKVTFITNIITNKIQVGEHRKLLFEAYIQNLFNVIQCI